MDYGCCWVRSSWFGIQSNDIQPSFYELLLCCLNTSFCFYQINSVNGRFNNWARFRCLRLDENSSKSKKRDRLFLSRQKISMCNYLTQWGMSRPTIPKFLALSYISLLAYIAVHTCIFYIYFSAGYQILLHNNSFRTYNKEINSSEGQILSDCGGIKLSLDLISFWCSNSLLPELMADYFLHRFTS